MPDPGTREGHSPAAVDLEAQRTTIPTLDPPSQASVTVKGVGKDDDTAASIIFSPPERGPSLQEPNSDAPALSWLRCFDVVVRNLSIATPPYRAKIPTPIPIPIPVTITDALRKWRNHHSGDKGTRDASDGLILHNVNATIRRGELMAVIGGSGSGKTTLLHAIAARLNLPIADGHVAIVRSNLQDDGAGGRESAGAAVGFVRQNDYLLPHLTGMFPPRLWRREGCGASATSADTG